MLQNNKIPFLYNPSNFTEKELVSNFVIRLKEFEFIFDAVKNDEMKNPPQHFLILGQRGYGKTTLLLRLRMEIKNDDKLKEHFIPILFDEEQYHISNLAKLWEEILKKLAGENEIFNVPENEIDKLYHRASPEEEMYNLLISGLKKHNKKLILLLDNFGEFIRKLKIQEVQRLREVLITSVDIKLIAASCVLLENFYEYQEPFFEFFRNINLDGLGRDETILLLKNLGENNNFERIDNIINKQPERIEALRRLTGGVPRTIALLFEIFLNDVTGNSFHDMEILIDRVTPLYKHRMDNLPAQQQAIVDAIAENWDAISTKEIAKITRLSSKTVSSQLNLLVKNQIVDKKETSTKNHLYQIKERFFNIYYLMRYGNKRDKNNILWLVKFFEIWLNKDELIERTLKHISLMQEKKIDERYAFHVSSALARIDIPLDIQDRLILETKKYLKEKDSEYTKDLDKSKLEIYDEVRKDILDNKIDIAYKKIKDTGLTESDINFYFGNILQFDLKDYMRAEKYYLKAIEKNDVDAMNNLAVLYQTEFKDFNKAEELFLKAIKENHISAMFNLAMMYQNELGDFEKAKEFLFRAVEENHIGAMNNLAFLYQYKYKDFKKAEELFIKAIEKKDVGAMNNLAILYEKELNNSKRAEKLFLDAIEKDNIEAIYNIAVLYSKEFKDFKKAEMYFLQAIDKHIVEAMYNLGILYEKEIKDFKSAEAIYLKAVKEGHIESIFNLAILYETKFKDFKNAEKYYIIASKQNHAGATNNLALLYFAQKQNKFQALKLISNINSKNMSISTKLIYIGILAWNNEIEKSITLMDEIMNNKDIEDKYYETLLFLFELLLAKKQYNYIYKLFKENKNNLKDKYKPFYYTVLYLLGDEYRDEYKKMGSEIEETVVEIIKDIERIAIEYA